MNKSLRFLAIGLALAVLLVSQVGVDRTAEALPIVKKNDTVEFAGPADDPAKAGEQQDFYRPAVEVDFYLTDPDLAQSTDSRVAQITWTIPSGGNLAADDGFKLRVPGGPGGAVAPDHDASDAATTTAETGWGAGQGQSGSQVTYTANDHWMGYMGDATTPLDGAPVVTVRNSTGRTGNNLVTSFNPETGEFFVINPVPGQDADEAARTATTTVEVTFKYHVADMIGEDQRGGTATTLASNNRVKVTSSSDGIGEWVKVSEVAAIGSTLPSPTTNIYYGSIYLEPDSKIASAEKGKIGVRDGDTLTVTLYEDDHVTVVDTDTATIDGEKPAILSISPADGTITDRSSPVVTITVTDDGSGFDTSFPRDHVDVFILDNITYDEDGEMTGAGITCRIYDTQLTATRLSSSEVDILFRNTGSWTTDTEGLSCDTGARTPGQTAIVGLPGNVASHNVDSTDIIPGDNNHGRQFVIRVVARDVAGNDDTMEAKVTIDTKAPSLVDGSTTGSNWDAKKKKDVEDRAAIKVVFNEALDASTVDASDFVVENPDVSIESVQVGGDGDEPNEAVYLKLSDDLASDARPRVELDGSIMDKAGNELKTAAIPRVEDGIEPGITVDAFSRQLLPAKGESTVTFSADENMAAETRAVSLDECTCLAITGGSGIDTERGDVILPTPPNGTYTFKQSKFSSTGIYGVLVQASDIRAQVTNEGAKKVTDEKTKAADVTFETEGDNTASSTIYTVTVGLAKWPLADAMFTGSLASAVSIKGDHDSAEVTAVDWEAGTVTLQVTFEDTQKTDDITDDMELQATYYYVLPEQTIEVDVSKPTATFMPDGDSQNASPFIRIQWDEREYAGDTHKTVTVTSATLTGPDDFEMVLVDDETDLLSTSDWELYSYLPDSGLALGEYTITATGRDEAGNVSEPQSGKFKVVARPPVTIPLNLGWNLVSLPGAAADSSIDAVINVDAVSQVLTYDPTVEGGWLAAVRVNGAFEGGLTNIDPSKAYLLYTTSVDDLKVDIPGFAQGKQDFPPTIQVYTGWNMIPASSLNPKFEVTLDTYLASITWTRGYFYGADGRIEQVTIGQDEQEMVKTGRGFLIYVEKDGVLVP